MVQTITSLSEIAADYDAIVLDQWGVLHDGTAPYPYAEDALARLKDQGVRLAVLSNSGKRAHANQAQLTRIGFPPGLFECVMTSGEALWREFAAGAIPMTRLHPITRALGDAKTWATGLDVAFAPIEQAEAVLLMGLPDTAAHDEFDGALAAALNRDLPVLCSNPDRTAPRKDGTKVVSPGTLAHDYGSRGGRVRFIGKPHAAVFEAVAAALDLSPERLLMVGDSLEHDIAGAHAAGWHSAFVRGGIYADQFDTDEIEDTIQGLARAIDAPLPDYTLDYLR